LWEKRSKVDQRRKRIAFGGKQKTQMKATAWSLKVREGGPEGPSKKSRIDTSEGNPFEGEERLHKGR